MSRKMTDYERIEADPAQRSGLRKEELILAVTCAIAEELERRGITKAELAARLGKTRAFVTQALGGEQNLTLGTIAEMADAIACKVSVRLQPSGRPAAKRVRARRARRPRDARVGDSVGGGRARISCPPPARSRSRRARPSSARSVPCS